MSIVTGRLSDYSDFGRVIGWTHVPCRVMAQPLSQTIIRMLAIVASILTISLAIYAASPWSGDSPYDSVFGYLGLIFFAGFAVGPYAYLFFRSAPQTDTALTQWLFAGIGIAITVLGIAVIYDATIISIDAQSGIVFFIIPIYQWIVLVATHWGFRTFLQRRN